MNMQSPNIVCVSNFILPSIFVKSNCRERNMQKTGKANASPVLCKHHKGDLGCPIDPIETTLCISRREAEIRSENMAGHGNSLAIRGADDRCRSDIVQAT